MTDSAQNIVDSIIINESSPVYVPNGKSAKATRVGKAHLGGSYILKYVLSMPDFKCNLIYVAKLMSDLNCRVIFHSNLCFIHDNTSRKTIGLGEL